MTSYIYVKTVEKKKTKQNKTKQTKQKKKKKKKERKEKKKKEENGEIVCNSNLFRNIRFSLGLWQKFPRINL